MDDTVSGDTPGRHEPTIIDLQHVPSDVRHRVAALSTHLGVWAGRATLPREEAQTDADLVLDTVDELLAGLRRLRRRTVRERRALVSTWTDTGSGPGWSPNPDDLPRRDDDNGSGEG